MTPKQEEQAIEIACLIMSGNENGLDEALSRPEGLEPLKKALEPKLLSVTFCSALESQARASDFYFNGYEIEKKSAPERIAVLLKKAISWIGPGQPDDLGAKKARMAERLAQAGWELGPDVVKAFSAYPGPPAEILLWMAEKGIFGPANASSEGGYDSICSSFNGETPRHLEILERLTKLGVLKDEEGFVGFTDFMAQHLFKCAQLLACEGFTPRTQVTKGRFRPGMSAVALYACLISEMGVRNPEEEAKTVERVKQDLAFLDRVKAPFAPKGQGSDSMNSDPFANSVSNRSRSPLVVQTLYEELLKRGANPNQSGFWLAEEASSVGSFCVGDVDRALKLGADPTLRPDALFSRLALVRDDATAIEWFDKLTALGADVTAVPSRAQKDLHPLGTLLFLSGNDNFAYVSHAIDHGLKPDWIDSETDLTALHALADNATKAGLDFTRRFLKDPRVKALVNHPTRSDGSSGGETPLMAAAGVLNARQIEILLNAGADPNARDAQGRTSLHHAGRKYGAKAQKKCADIVALLLAGGADPSLTNKKGLTAGQAMAKKAPLEGLAALLSLRPDDLGGATKEAQQAQDHLMKRGGHAVSLVENAVLSGVAGAAEAPKPKKKRL